jgi:hypothetical protein
VPNKCGRVAHAIFRRTRYSTDEKPDFRHHAFHASTTARDLRVGFRRTLPTQKTDCRAFVQGAVVVTRQSMLLILLVPSRA